MTCKIDLTPVNYLGQCRRQQDILAMELKLSNAIALYEEVRNYIVL